MAINELSTLIELVATLSIAFVAVEYVKSYTYIVCEKIFNFNKYIESELGECREMLTDIETLNHIEPVNIGGKSTNSAIEETKREHESLFKKIAETIQKVNSDIGIVCQTKSMSSLCYFMFLSNLGLLFLGSLENKSPDIIYNISVIYCIGTMLYLIIGWIIGEKNDVHMFFNVASLRHSTISFVVIVLISIILGIFCIPQEGYISESWWYIILSSVLLSYVNFIVFALKVWIKARSFKDKINKIKTELSEQCASAEKDVEDLMSTNRLSAKLRAD